MGNNLSTQKRQSIEKDISSIVSQIFDRDIGNIHVVGELKNAPTRYTGIYASIIINHSSITWSEIEQLQSNGIYFVENAGHVTKNPSIDKNSIKSIQVDDLKDAAEIESELIVELSEPIVN